MTQGRPPAGLEVVHANRFGNEMNMEEALTAIRRVYARGYHLPDKI